MCFKWLMVDDMIKILMELTPNDQNIYFSDIEVGKQSFLREQIIGHN